MIKSFSGIVLIILGTQVAISQDIPVDHYTGRPLINIPLVTISDRGLSFPVSLSYDATGVKVNSSNGMVGQNWSLTSSQVTRDLRGLPDDVYEGSGLRAGWLFNSNASGIASFAVPADGTAIACTTTSNSLNDVMLGWANKQDTEPDMFHFNAPGLSGSFVFDNSGSITGIKLIPYQDVSVEAYRGSSTSPISKFTIINASGVKYIFSDVESTIRMTPKKVGEEPLFFKRDYKQYTNFLTYYSAWKLTSITSPVGEKITLTYLSNEKNSGSDVNYALTGTYDNPVPPEKTHYSVTEYIYEKIISSISSPHQTINFDFSGSGHDVMLDQIIVNEQNANAPAYIRSIKFGYTNYESYIDFTHRVFLNTLTWVDNCKAQRPYRFYYNGIINGRMNLPQQGNPNQDIWGYYTSTGADHLYPKLYIYPSQSGINKISLYPKTGMSDEIVIPGANRIVEGTSNSGTLSLIDYPSGATTGFTYESHEFYNPIISGFSKGGGLRIASIQLYDGIINGNIITKTYEYKDLSGNRSGKLLSLPTFWMVNAAFKNATNGYVTSWVNMSALSTSDKWKKSIIRRDVNLSDDNNDLSPVAYEYVIEKTGTSQGKTLYKFDVPFVFGASASGDWNPTFMHISRSRPRSSCPDPGLNTPSFYQHPFVRQTPYDFARGLLLQTSVYKEGDSNPEKQITNVYADKSISSATVKGLKYEYVPYDSMDKDYFMYGVYSLVTNKLRVLTKTTEKTKSKAATSYLQTVTDFTYASNHTFLKSSTTTTSDSTQIMNEFKYVKDYGAPQAVNSGTNLQVQMLDSMYLSGQVGTLIEQISSSTPFSGSKKTFTGSLILFKNFGKASAPVIRPKEMYSLKTTGISSYNLSSVTGSGTSRVFNKDSAYKKMATLQFGPFGDLIRKENDQRQFQSFHPDNLSGIAITTIQNAEPGEVIYSNFDQDTKYDFDLSSGFTTLDKTGWTGRTGSASLGGFKASTATTKYLTKTLVKRPGTKYLFSTWYRSDVITGTHSIIVIIKNTADTQLQTRVLTFPVAAYNTWYYNEQVLNLDSISDTQVKVEVRFKGSFSGGGSLSSQLDEISFVPVGTLLVRNSYNTAYGLNSSTSSDGLLIEQERTPDGEIKYVRDKDRNILQKVIPSRFIANGQPDAPISIDIPNEIYKGDTTYFHAITACLDFTTIEWKIDKTGPYPLSGSFAAGSLTFKKKFDSLGTHVISLRLSHASYGNYTVSVPITVISWPLDVSICVQDGPVSVDLCLGTSVPETESCSGTFSSSSYYSTTFSTSINGTGCSGTYTYAWERRPYGDTNGYWEGIAGATGSTVTMVNTQSYDLRVTVGNATCGRSGKSNIKSVLVYKSNPSCPDPIAP